jgi:uncharacterized protein (TIGR03435 family)
LDPAALAVAETQGDVSGRDVFELTSVKPLPPSRGDSVATDGPSGCRTGGWIGAIQIDPNRITVPAITVAALVNLAYGQDCFLVEGGPDWIRMDRFNVQALIPATSPVYTRRDLTEGKALKLQTMLQNLLLDRFALIVRREKKEMPVYALVVSKVGKMQLSEDQTPPGAPSLPQAGDRPRGRDAPLARGSMSLLTAPSGVVTYSAKAVPIWELTKIFQGQVGRPVLDKTELKGLFDIRLQFFPESSLSTSGLDAGSAPRPHGDGPTVPTGPLLRTAIQEQLGLTLESIRAPVDVLVIERVEKPREN